MELLIQRMPKPSLNTQATSAASSRKSAAAIPRFALYGEPATPGEELLHIEEVESGELLYHWEIDAHLHQGLYQILWLARGSADVMLDEWRAMVRAPPPSWCLLAWCTAFISPPRPTAWCSP